MTSGFNPAISSSPRSHFHITGPNLCHMTPIFRQLPSLILCCWILFNLPSSPLSSPPLPSHTCICISSFLSFFPQIILSSPPFLCPVLSSLSLSSSSSCLSIFRAPERHLSTHPAVIFDTCLMYASLFSHRTSVHMQSLLPPAELSQSQVIGFNPTWCVTWVRAWMFKHAHAQVSEHDAVKTLSCFSTHAQQQSPCKICLTKLHLYSVTLVSLGFKFNPSCKI